MITVDEKPKYFYWSKRVEWVDTDEVLGFDFEYVHEIDPEVEVPYYRREQR